MIVGLKKTILIVSTFQIDIRLILNNNHNNIELHREAKINANERFFNLIAVANKYIKTFIYGKNCLQVQIKTIEN